MSLLFFRANSIASARVRGSWFATSTPTRSVPGIGRTGAEKFGATGGGSLGKIAGGTTPPGTGVGKGVAVGKGVGEGSWAETRTAVISKNAITHHNFIKSEFRNAEFIIKLTLRRFRPFARLVLRFRRLVSA